MGESRNMAGLTEAEIRRRLEGRGACAAVAAACLVAGALIALGAVVMAACGRWPVLCHRLPPIGFICLGVGLQMAWSGRRSNHGD